MLKYSKLIENKKFSTGDLLLFSHKDNCTSCCNCLFTCFTDLIKCCTCSKYSHAAMIIEKKHAVILNPILNKEEYYVLQSSYENFPDAENHELKLGVEIVSLNELFSTYEGKIFWREVLFERNDVFISNLIDAHSVVHNRPYDTNLYDWFRAAFDIHLGPKHRLDTFWCSALVSYMYTRFGLLNKDLDWTLVSPAMLSDKSKNPKFKNCIIHDEVRVL
jgi:hypothetical protein